MISVDTSFKLIYLNILNMTYVILIFNFCSSISVIDYYDSFSTFQWNSESKYMCLTILLYSDYFSRQVKLLGQSLTFSNFNILNNYFT